MDSFNNKPWFSLSQGLCILLFILCLGMVIQPLSLHAQSADQIFSQAVNKYVNGQDRQALTLLEKALKVNPEHKNAQELRTQIIKELPQDKQPIPSDTQNNNATAESAGPEPASSNMDQQPRQQSESGSVGEINQKTSGREPVGETVPSARESGTTTFQPLPEEERRTESPVHPKLSEEPIDTTKYINEDYSVESRRSHAVYGVEAKQFNDRVRYIIHASGTVDVITSQIYNPPMIVIDIPNTTDKLPTSPLPIKYPNNKRVRHSQYRLDPMNVTRVVIDLENWHENYEIYRDPPGDKIVVDVFKTSADMGSSDKQQTRAGNDKDGVDTGKEIDSAQKTDQRPDVKFRVLTGDQQTLKPTQTIDKPLSVRLTNRRGQSLANENVIYEVLQGQGKVITDLNGVESVARTKTNSRGVAQAQFQAGEKAGSQIVEASVPDRGVSVSFRVEVIGGEPAEIRKVKGNKQETMFGRPVESPLVVEVLDQYGNPVPDVRVEVDDLSQEGFIDVNLDDEGIQRAGQTGPDGRFTVDMYRIASNRSTNKLRLTAINSNGENLTTTFTIYGHAQLLSIDFKEANLQDVLRTLAEIAQWNIVQAEQVEGRPISEMTVSVHLRDVTAIRALDTILDVKGLSRVSDGNVIKIVPKRDAIRKGVPVLSPSELGEYQGNNMVTVTYQLTYLTANSELAGKLQEALMAENSSIVPDENSNSITITDLANNQQKIRKILNQIDQPNEKFNVEVIELQYKDAESLQQELTNLLPLGQQASIEFNARSNALMVYGEATLIERIKTLVKAVDRSGKLQDNFTFIDMTGFDEVQMANRVNAILGLQVIPLEELTNIDFDFETSQDAIDFIRSARQIDIDELLESANIIPMPRLNQILIFGPKDIQETAKTIIEKLKTSQAGYVDSQVFQWYQSKTIPMEQLTDLIGNIGNLQIETEISEFDALLLSAPDSASLNEGLSFIKRVDRADLGSYAFEVVKIERGDPDRILSKVNEILAQQSLSEQQESIFVIGPGDNVPQQQGTSLDEILDQMNVITFESANSIILVGPSNFRNFVRELIRQVEASIDELAQFKWMWYRPKTLPIQRLVDMLERTQFGEVEAALIEQNLILIRSKNKNDFKKLRQILSNLDPEDLAQGRKLVVYTPQFIDPSELADDIETYFEDLKSFEQEAGGGGGGGEPIPRVLHAGEQRVIFVVNKVDASLLRELMKKMDKNFYSDQSVLTYVPENVTPDDLEEELDNLNIGRLLYVDDNRISLLVPSDQKQKIRKIFREVDTSGFTTNVVYLKHTRSEKILTSLQKIQQNMDLNVSFSADQASNSIIFSSSASSKNEIRALINKLDRWQKQVFIEGMILEYTLNEGNEFRYQWFLNPEGNQVNNTDRVPAGDAGAQLGNLSQFGSNIEGTFTAILNDQDFQAVLSVLANESQSEVLAKPQITAINNQQASIRVGDEQEIRIQRQTEQGVVSSLQTVEAFTELQVTPTITSNRHVLMDILISSDQFTTPNSDNVQTQTTRRQTENSVLVKDGQTVVIGGLIEEESTDGESGIPYLKDIPFAGNLFKSSEESTAKRELVIFLTPHVIEDPAESRRQSQRVSDNLQQITPLAINVNIARQSKLARIQGLSPDGNEERRRKLARQIVLHRETFGPYRNFSELLEVSGMTEEILNNIIYRIEYRVDLNTVSIDELLMIKNINHKMAQAVIDERQRQGIYESLETVKQILLDHGLSESYFKTFLRPVLFVSGHNAPGGQTSNTGQSGDSSQSTKSSSKPGIRSGPSPGEASQSPSLPSLDDL